MCRILLVDDHTAVRVALAHFLLTAPDLTVVAEAADGLQAVETAARYAPDVIVMDLHMPRLSGLEATRRILADRPGACIIAYSACTDAATRDAARAAGAAAFVSKLDSPHALMAVIRRLFPPASPHARRVSPAPPTQPAAPTTR